MGQLCVRSGGVAEDGKEETRRKTPMGGKKGKECSAVTNRVNKTTKDNRAIADADEPVRDCSPEQEFTVVKKIEALLHTMRPTVPVVSSWDLRSDFRQFTSIFPKGSAALSVVSCQDAMLPQQVLVAGEDCSIAQVNYETGHVMRRWIYAHRKDITCLTRPSATGIFASSGRDCVARVWNLNRDDPMAVLEGHTLTVTSVDVDLGSSLVVSGSKDSTVRLWDIDQSKEIFCSGNDKPNVVTFVRFLPNTSLVAQGAEDLAVRLWDVRSPPTSPALTLSSTMTNTSSIPLCCDISPSRFTRIMTGHSCHAGESSCVQEWDVRQGKSIRTYTGHTSSVTCLRMATSALFGDTTFFTASKDGTMGFWSMEPPSSTLDIAEMPIGHQFRVPEGAVTCCECEGNGDVIVTLRSGSMVVFRPEKSGEAILPAKRFRYIGTMDEEKSLAP